VTSPSQPATWQLFEAAARYLGDDCEVRRPSPFELQTGPGGRLEFVSPADLLVGDGLARLRNAQFLFVDEAAGLPVDVVVELLWRARRVVMSTTLDGYEGSGQGFMLRALPQLRIRKQELRHFELQAPMRWNVGCPLEKLANAAMLLDAKPVGDDLVADASVENSSFEVLDQQVLSEWRREDELSRYSAC